ncbi:unnamed protein product [Mycetohabitans rhizoxinica HKI 454]|uniref:Uncharacterized protein n=1 Tax=Mycetohabitans rhizoxinica (strain DSM 19002 / CIP 109453 / HKI 454) TaxID=882378 RepID=E5AND0_MYCRK|nr:unnamed protein product [Mycetohabitans rhizoxinica HKI 454]
MSDAARKLPILRLLPPRAALARNCAERLRPTLARAYHARLSCCRKPLAALAPRCVCGRYAIKRSIPRIRTFQ